MKINKRNFIDYTLLLLTISMSGIPFFSTADLYIPLFFILLFFFIIRKISIDSTIIVVLVLLLVVVISQSIVFNFYSTPNILGVFLRIINGYLIVKILNIKFLPYYINILYYMAIVSLIFYIPMMLVPPLQGFLLQIASFFEIFNIAGSSLHTIVFYNIHLYHLENFRNSGPFWEPGAFAGYLTLAFMFILIMNQKKFKRKGIVILIVILTTLSTTAILALFIFSFFIFYKRIKNVLFRNVVIAFVVGIGYYAYFQLDFLGAKIESQIERANSGADLYLEDTNTQRFLNILRDMNDFKGHELVGRGSHPITRYEYQMEGRQIRTVGLTDILVRMGAVFFALMMFLLYRSICSLVDFYNTETKLMCFATFISVLVLLMSETYFQFPIFWSLLFLQLVFIKPKNNYQ